MSAIDWDDELASSCSIVAIVAVNERGPRRNLGVTVHKSLSRSWYRLSRGDLPAALASSHQRRVISVESWQSRSGCSSLTRVRLDIARGHISLSAEFGNSLAIFKKI